MDLGENLPKVTGDRVQLQQVLLNLAINAMDAMSTLTDPPRIVRIRTSAPDAKRVAIGDAGLRYRIEAGATGSDCSSRFSPPRKRRARDVAPSISWSIVEAHGGRLLAANNQGRGAIFSFTLPTGERLP